MDHQSNEALQMLSTAFSTNTLVPVIGAGFTSGCQTSGGRTVPSGVDFRNEMLETISNHNCLSAEQKEKLSKHTFSEIADFYFNEDWVPKETVKKQLEKAFQGVQLKDWQCDFIKNINWPYVYTLNIDDGIEQFSKYVPVLPYDENLSKTSQERPTLFKLHGDINYELRHETSRLIFKKTEYLQSMKTNSKMLDLLKLDISSKNIVYIGCSISDELDIAFIVAEQNKLRNNYTKNILFLSKRLDIIDEQKYKNIGINTIILFEDGKFYQIYDLLIKAYQKSASISNSLSAYNKPINTLTENPLDNKNFLTQGIIDINNKQPKSNHIIPYYYSEREIEEKIDSSIKNNEITILHGNRVSGKTLTAYNVLNRYKNKSIYIVNSSQRINEETILQLLGQENSIVFLTLLAYHTKNSNLFRAIEVT